MSTIKDSLSRKNEQNPQFDYLWRVELPRLDLPTGDMIAGGLGIPGAFDSARDLVSGGGGSFSFANAVGVANQIASIGQNISNLNFSDLTGVHEINHRVYTVSVPFKSFDTTKVTSGPSFTYNAAHSDIGALSMTIDEMEDGKTLSYITKWMSLMEPSSWTRAVPAQYKRDIRYIKMSGSKLDLHYSVYKGYFPTEVSPIESSYDGNGIMQYNVTFTGDDVDHVIIPEAQVVSMISAEEEAILRQNFDAGNGFRIGAIDTAKTARVLDNVLEIFRR